MDKFQPDPTRDWYLWYEEGVKKGTFPFHDEYFLFTCPCCGYPTLGMRGGFEACVICYWEDDGQDARNADQVLGGPNGDYSLAEARKCFDHYFTCYRPSDTNAFTLSKLRIEQAKLLTPRLAPFRWAGRVPITPRIDFVLGKMSKIH